ncbi:hypothetical protein AAVH_37526, partial [Aphelenchoides avenae]
GAEDSGAALGGAEDGGAARKETEDGGDALRKRVQRERRVRPCAHSCGRVQRNT